MKKGILNEVNEIRRMMGLVSEQNDSIMDMLSSAFNKMNLGGVIDSIGDFDIDGVMDAISELDYDLIYDELSKLPKPVSEKLIDYIIEYVDKFSIPGIVGIVDKKQLIDIKNKLMSVWNESSVNEQNSSDRLPKSDDNVRVEDFQPFIGKDLFGGISSPKEGKRIIKKFGIEKGKNPGWDVLQIFTEKNETDAQHDADNQADRLQDLKQFRLRCQSSGLSYWDYGAVRSWPLGHNEPDSPLDKQLRKVFCLVPGENPYNNTSVNEQSDIKPSAQKSGFPKNDEILNKLSNTPDGGKKVTPDFGSADVIYPNGKTKSGKCWCSTKDGIVVAGCDGIENHCKGATYLPNRI